MILSNIYSVFHSTFNPYSLKTNEWYNIVVNMAEVIAVDLVIFKTLIVKSSLKIIATYIAIFYLILNIFIS